MPESTPGRWGIVERVGRGRRLYLSRTVGVVSLTEMRRTHDRDRGRSQAPHAGDGRCPAGRIGDGRGQLHDEPGCIDYRFTIDIDDPLVVRVFEQWESPDALEAHFAMPHFLAFSEVMLRAVDGPADFTRYEVSSAGPLFG